MKTAELLEKIKSKEIDAPFLNEESIKNAAETKDGIYELFKKAGVTDSEEEFYAVMESIYETVSNELTSEELDMVAGGSKPWLTWLALDVVLGETALFRLL